MNLGPFSLEREALTTRPTRPKKKVNRKAEEEMRSKKDHKGLLLRFPKREVNLFR